MNDDGAHDFLATCDDCGSAYAATLTDDGDVLPLGARNGCQCGGTSFSRVSEDDLTDASDA
ncbi:hypothetical protein [Halobiforma nitratireducens]|uniref:Uncharacterized protein n=1 Tax=Halobiforma nitratireducens JCM 10879 TaxID=1227454 RepID=M0LZL6_9EURY|nr:hypothetical protein [Halobiforma nitratireducens]EMA38608.1 hypothetical protein C446_09670 [Halobiforma nitratireducens JCM 10879]